jgi:hypothetical protein
MGGAHHGRKAGIESQLCGSEAAFVSLPSFLPRTKLAESATAGGCQPQLQLWARFSTLRRDGVYAPFSGRYRHAVCRGLRNLRLKASSFRKGNADCAGENIGWPCGLLSKICSLSRMSALCERQAILELRRKCVKTKPMTAVLLSTKRQVNIIL